MIQPVLFCISHLPRQRLDEFDVYVPHLNVPNSSFTHCSSLCPCDVLIHDYYFAKPRTSTQGKLMEMVKTKRSSYDIKQYGAADLLSPYWVIPCRSAQCWLFFQTSTLSPRRCFALVHHVRKQDDLQYHAIPSSLIPVIRKLYKSWLDGKSEAMHIAQSRLTPRVRLLAVISIREYQS